MGHNLPSPYIVNPDCGESSDIAGESSVAYPCWGEIHKVRWLDAIRESNNQKTAGVQFDGVVQFFDLTGWPIYPLRRHSCLVFAWDSNGKLVELELDNYKGDIERTTLWSRDFDASSPDEQVSADLFFDESSCPVDLPFVAASSDTPNKVAGFVVRTMCLTGRWKHDSSEHILSCDTATGEVPIWNGAVELDCAEEISSYDPTVGDVATEMAWEFDSSGCLMRIYWGGVDACEPNPCVWDRDKPPPRTAGVVVPVLKFLNDEQDNNFEIWHIHFTSNGTYIRSCLYARICGCETAPPSSSPPACLCEEFACVVTGNCTRPEDENYCPATATFTCAEAAENAENCEPIEDLYCVYSRDDTCCGQPGPSSLASWVPSSSSGAESCQYSGDAGACGSP